MSPNIKHRPQRKDVRREEGGRVIIVCEGSKTEKYYFEAIRRSLRRTSIQIAVYHPHGTNAGLIVDFAIRKRQEQRKETTWNDKLDSVWAVYDGVEHFRHNPTDWHKALDLAKSNNIRLAITNPSFELWYLLHFQNQTKWLERDAAYIQLKEKYIKAYEKGDVLYPEPLKERTDIAIDRAHKLAKTARENGQLIHECLCAEGVADLVKLLLSLAPPT